jgi:hypothetical protein
MSLDKYTDDEVFEDRHECEKKSDLESKRKKENTHGYGRKQQGIIQQP